MEEIKEASEKAQEIIDKTEASRSIIKKMMQIVKNFIQKHRVICYGGAAINNLLPKEKQFYNPEVDINDGGLINYNYAYCSLLIPWIDYINMLKPKLVKVRGSNVRIEIKSFTQDNSKIFKKLRNINLCVREHEDSESEEFEQENEQYEKSKFEQDGIYYLYSMCKTFGYIHNSKFIKLENKDLGIIAHFLSNHL